MTTPRLSPLLPKAELPTGLTSRPGTPGPHLSLTHFLLGDIGYGPCSSVALRVTNVLSQWGGEVPLDQPCGGVGRHVHSGFLRCQPASGIKRPKVGGAHRQAAAGGQGPRGCCC